MTIRRVISIFLLTLISIDSYAAQTVTSGKRSDDVYKCEVAGGNYSKEAAVIYGKPYTSPSMRIRLFKDKTNDPLAGASINILYVWKWLQYPYPETSCGAFMPATELLRCISDDAGIVVVPEHTVDVRGWSQVPKCWWSLVHKKGEPYFDNIEIRISNGQYSTGFTLSKGKMESYRNKEMVVHVPVSRLVNGYGIPIDKKTGKPIRP